MIWHSSTFDEIKQELNTNFEKGLSDAIANYRLKDFNDNFSPTVSVTPFWTKLSNGIKQPITLLLLTAAVLFLFIETIMPAYDENHLKISIIVIAFTLLFTIIKALIGYTCELIIVKEQQATAPKAVVIRGGIEKTINSVDVVPGDIIVLRSRCSIPADARLLKCDNLICNESAITGINVPTVKDSSFECADITPLGERANMVYAGTWVSHGYGLAVVTETGDETEFGKRIAIERKPAMADIDNSLFNLRKMLSQVSAYLAIILFIIIALITRFTDAGYNLTLLSIATHTLLISSSIAIVCSPVAISEISTLTTAIGILRLKKNNISVTNAAVIDEMGLVNCICVDKSAITEHCMTATEIYNGVDVLNITNGISNDTAMLLRLAASASLNDGDSTDKAIIDACSKYANTTKDDIDNLYPRLSYVPFDRETMTTVSVNMIDGQPYAIVKGAAETVASFCSNDTQHIINSAEAMGTRALHVVAVAVKLLSNVSDTVNPSKEELYGGLSFLGLIGLNDPIKADIRPSVMECQDADIKVMLFTGDSLATAKAIARQAGILTDDQQAVLGCELENLNDYDLLERVKSHTVFARITPTLRNRIIQLLTDSGYILASTGRSATVNAAIDSANIGCALANTSSDAIKRTADVILNDDSFKSIVSMVKGGRNIFSNIRHSIASIFTINIALILIELFGYFIWQNSVFNSVQIIASIILLNLVTVFTVAFEPYVKLRNKPNSALNRTRISYAQKIYVTWQSVLLTVIALISYGFASKIDSSVANAACFVVFVASAIVSIIGNKTGRSILSSETFANKIGLISTLVLFVLCFVFAAKTTSELSELMPVLIILSIIPLLAIETSKIISKLKRSK